MLRRIIREKTSLVARRYESTLRAQPWAFQEKQDNFQKTQTRSTVARFNLDMALKADVGAFPAVFALAAEMKQQGIKPTISTYNTLLRGLAQGGYGSAAWAALEDMLAVGITPDTTSLNHILDAHRGEASTFIPYILTKLEELGVKPNATTYTLLITRFVAEENLELAVQYLHAMRTKHLIPDVAAAQAVIVLAANQGFPRLAVDIAVSFEKETVRKVEDSVWLACLHSSAAELYAEGVSKSWYTLVSDLAVSPDEGLCTLVLHTAARNGLPDLATDALRILKVLDVPWMEHHLAPLFEAFCRAERYQDAFSTLAIMRSSNILPTTHTAVPIFQVVQRRPELLDVLWETLGQMHKEGKTVDPAACAALLRASFATQPLTRALGDYNTLKSLGIDPSPETFHIFIDGCIAAGNVAYGELAFQQLKEAGVSLDHDVFGKMITLHLTQEHLYMSLAVKCATLGDHRYLVALDEMKEVGYKVDPEFRAHCTELNEAVAKFGSVGMDGSAQQFIETGGLSGLETPRTKSNLTRQ
ncbi:hypothetical protein B0H14DRAFT_2668377 [Mycena olivaceomarginata]|nr:hypothetical protein B0H14DRAFT_2668377 [Mycena olivaceomarginata]